MKQALLSKTHTTVLIYRTRKSMWENYGVLLCILSKFMAHARKMLNSTPNVEFNEGWPITATLHATIFTQRPPLIMFMQQFLPNVRL